ncbi:hypothetical protein FBU30_000231 [Linnemannia zychae]|nr:hypothetical protein FBU30_000231 [Linnemannia zychae]
MRLVVSNELPFDLRFRLHQGSVHSYCSITNYVKELEVVEARMIEFYSGGDNRYNRHLWDMKRRVPDDRKSAPQGNRWWSWHSLRPFEACSHKRRSGQFSTNSRLSSLHSSFLDYFIPKATIIVGLNKFFMSKKRPGCGRFVGQVDFRRLYCSTCHVYHQCGIVAAENMANIIQGYLKQQERPDYFHPVAKDGTLPWKMKRNNVPISTTSSSTTSTINHASDSARCVRGYRKRTSIISALEQDYPCHLEVLDAFRMAMVCKRLKAASMSMIGANLANFTSLPVTIKDRFRVTLISPDIMKILKRYQSINVSRTGVTTEDILRLIRCGIKVATINQCFNIDKRSLLSGLREYGVENPDVFVSLHTARIQIMIL